MELQDLQLALQSLWALLFDDATLRELALSGDPKFKRCADIVNREAIRLHRIGAEAERRRCRDDCNGSGATESTHHLLEFECCICRRPVPRDWVHLSACPTCSPICTRCRYDLCENASGCNGGSTRPSTSGVVRAAIGGGNDGSGRMRWHGQMGSSGASNSVPCPLCRQSHELGRPSPIHVRWRGTAKQVSVPCV